MATLVLTDPINDAVNDPALIAANNAAIKAVVNGGIDQTNITAGQVLSLATTGTGRKIAYGTGQLTWPGGGSYASNTLTVTHGLGATPVNIVVSVGTPSDSAGAPTAFLTTWPVLAATNAGGTTFKVTGFMADAGVAAPGNTGTCDFSWQAIG